VGGVHQVLLFGRGYGGCRHGFENPQLGDPFVEEPDKILQVGRVGGKRVHVVARGGYRDWAGWGRRWKASPGDSFTAAGMGVKSLRSRTSV